ncbi:MAG: phosphatidate cytidylyltransferase, partial [Muribaculaceae bacterium]|nr:phosphatidate cytidylyltransferase [Muribaculaceae bacterium]
MIVRALSGAVYVGLIVASLLLGAPYFALLMAIFALLGVNELQRLLSGVVPVGLSGRVLDYLMIVCTFGAFTYLDSGIAIFFVFALLYLPLRIIAAVMSREENPARALMYSLFSLFYIGFPLVTLTFACYGWSKLILLTFIIIWLNDTGAYLTGCTMGRTKLCERLSPQKTWEGFWGGFILSAIAGGIGLYLLVGSHSWSA